MPIRLKVNNNSCSPYTSLSSLIQQVTKNSGSIINFRCKEIENVKQIALGESYKTFLRPCLHGCISSENAKNSLRMHLAFT